METAKPKLYLITDIIEGTREVAKAIKDIVDIPKETRREYLNVIDKTMALCNETLLLVISRLTDLLYIAEEDKSRFFSELSNVNYYDKWLTIEREVRLCKNLRATDREMNGLLKKLGNRIALRDPAALSRSFSYLLGGEADLANFISQSLRGLANMANEARESPDGFSSFNKMIAEIRNVRDAFYDVSHKLIELQNEVSKYI